MELPKDIVAEIINTLVAGQISTDQIDLDRIKALVTHAYAMGWRDGALAQRANEIDFAG